MVTCLFPKLIRLLTPIFYGVFALVYGCELGGIVKMNVEKTKVVATRVTMKTAELIAEFCKRDTHVNPADFIRDAIRDKLQREATELYHQLFEEAYANEY
jgi:hypothetical protein